MAKRVARARQCRANNISAAQVEKGQTMIDLYAGGSPNVLRVILGLEELELPYRIHIVNVFAGDQFSPDFTSLNPNSKIPVIIDQDGPDNAPYTLFESGVILTYLADKTGRLLSKEPRARFDALQWLTLQITTVGPLIGQLVHFLHYAPPMTDEYSLNRFRTHALRVLHVIDARLAQQPYLGGDEYTIADIAFLPWTLKIAENLGQESEGALGNVVKWRIRVSDRPAVARALKIQSDIRSRSVPVEKADSRTLAKVFGTEKKG